MKIITVTNRKGGTGKTLTTRSLAGGLASKGYKVLMIDLDGQRNLSLIMSIAAEHKGIYEVLSGECGLADAIAKTEQGDIIPASDMLYTFDKDIKSPYALQKVLKGIKGYDFILIDTAPSFNALTVAAMIASDGLIVPTQADLFSLSALKEIKEEIDTLKEYKKGLKIYGICITRYANNRISKDMKASLEAIAGIIGTKVYKEPIRENVAIKESTATGQSIFAYAPKSNGARDYMALADEFLKDMGA